MNFSSSKSQVSGRSTCTSVSPSVAFSKSESFTRFVVHSGMRLNPTVPDDGKQNQIRSYYRALFQAWGRQNWWPARSRFEVIVGAYLTQNTAWTNVEKALANLRAAKML